MTRDVDFADFARGYRRTAVRVNGRGLGDAVLGSIDEGTRERVAYSATPERIVVSESN